MRKTAFAPAIRPDIKVLVLGSLPGDASLAAGQYYAHPRNQFWQIVGNVIGRDLRSLGYELRLVALISAGIGLWDTIASAQRRGSLDAAMRDVRAAELERLIAGLPHLRAIGFNGATSARIGRRQLAATDRALPVLVDLPSTSPAYCAKTVVEKQQEWNLLRKFLD